MDGLATADAGEPAELCESLKSGDKRGGPRRKHRAKTTVRPMRAGDRPGLRSRKTRNCVLGPPGPPVY